MTFPENKQFAKKVFTYKVNLGLKEEESVS